MSASYSVRRKHYEIMQGYSPSTIVSFFPAIMNINLSTYIICKHGLSTDDNTKQILHQFYILYKAMHFYELYHS